MILDLVVVIVIFVFCFEYVLCIRIIWFVVLFIGKRNLLVLLIVLLSNYEMGCVIDVDFGSFYFKIVCCIVMVENCI